MIHLAIDEMLSAECRIRNEEETRSHSLRHHSTCGLLHPSSGPGQLESDDEEARLERFHRQVREGDE